MSPNKTVFNKRAYTGQLLNKTTCAPVMSCVYCRGTVSFVVSQIPCPGHNVLSRVLCPSLVSCIRVPVQCPSPVSRSHVPARVPVRVPAPRPTMSHAPTSRPPSPCYPAYPVPHLLESKAVLHRRQRKWLAVDLQDFLRPRPRPPPILS